MANQKQINLPWWKEVFNEIYLQSFERLLTEKKTRQEVDWLVKVLDLKKTDNLLDIPCGPGRHCLELAARGFDITGVDYSRKFLKEANKRKLQENKNLQLIKADMRTIKLKKKFSVVLNLGNSFGYFSDKDNIKVIKNFSALLKTKGLLVLDLPNTAGMLRDIISSRKEILKNGYLLTENLSFDPLSFRLNLRWTIVQDNQKYVYEGELRLYTFQEIKSILSDYRLKVVNVFGNFYGADYNIDTQRMIIIAEKI